MFYGMKIHMCCNEFDLEYQHHFITVSNSLKNHFKDFNSTFDLESIEPQLATNGGLHVYIKTHILVTSPLAWGR